MDYYELLQISPNASITEIKKAFRELAKKYHPDINPNNKQAEEQFKKISNAYKELSNPNRRKKYDAWRKSYNSQRTTSNRSQGSTNQKTKSDQKQKAEERRSQEDAFEERRRQAEQRMHAREQKIRDEEDRLRREINKLKSKKRVFYTVALIIVIIQLFFGKGGYDQYQKLTAKNDSLNFELRCSQFLINYELDKSQLQKARSIITVYDMNSNDIHSYTSLDIFLQEMRDRKKAQDVYGKLVNANINVNMNFDQFYKTVKLDKLK